MIGAPVSYAYVAELAPPHMKGRYQGLYGVTFSCGAIFGPALGTLIYSHAATGFWALCGAMGLLAALFVLGSRGRRGAHHVPAEVGPPDGGPSEPPGDLTILLPEAEPLSKQDS